MPPPPRVNDNDYHYHAYDFANSAPWTPGLGQPSRHGWSFYSMVRDLQGLQAYGAGNVPNIALNNIGAQTIGGRDTMMLSFGNNAANLPSIVISGGIHAREWIATEFAYLLAEYLVRNYILGPDDIYGRAIRSLVNSRMIHFIPMVNPDGNNTTVFGIGPNDRYWRKNRRVLPTNGVSFGPDVAPVGVPNLPFQNFQAPPMAIETYDVPDYDPAAGIPPNPAQYRNWDLDPATGVDLNRNLNTPAWGYECGVNYPNVNSWPRSEAYFGPNRTSEIETGNLQLAMAASGPAIAASIDYHSYGKMIIYSGEESAAGPIRVDYLSLGQQLQQLIRAQGQNVVDYQLGTPFQTVGYNAASTVMDHAALQYQSRAFTIELDPAPGQGLAGFDLPQAGIRTVFEKNIRGALALIAAPNNAVGAPAVPLAQLQIALSALQFFVWNVYGRGNRLP